jgi:hypothetical protein
VSATPFDSVREKHLEVNRVKCWEVDLFMGRRIKFILGFTTYDPNFYIIIRTLHCSSQV